MAVEAHHLNLFPSQILANNRELSMMNSFENGNMLATPTNIAGSFGLLPPYNNSFATNTVVPIFANDINIAMKSESGLTYAVPNSRKRSRDIMINHPIVQNNHAAKNSRGCFSFLGEDISYQIQQQQLEMDRFIVQHTENVRSEIEHKRKRFAHNILSSMEETITKSLKTKEEEIKKIGKLNYALEQRVKSLCMENQIWRDLAQNNEATANALRTNLEQILSQMQPRAEETAVVEDDEQSCCGDNNYEEMEHANVPRNGCKMCGKKEACVLVLPCRHLCLCSECGSMSIHTCPVCNSVQTASLHVNLT